ncbi:MAG: ATP-binding protein [Deltaproteobacteria bacterium]|nr:ATP-binding protein [Deltaproteobacteria bacterium]
MSHEIRTPVTAVLGYTDEILEGGDLTQIPPERLHSIGAIRRNSYHLLQIINDILDLSKIEAGKLEVERIRFAPAQIVADVLSQMRVRAIEKGLDLRLVFSTLVPETIESDPLRVRQILINLLGNAIKFTDRGVIRLVTRLIQDEEFPQIQFEVIDPGIGMTAEQTSRLFEPFTQADSSTTRKYGGTRLGLSICRRLVELLDGTIELESEVGSGSTFRIRLPIGSLEGVALIDNPMLLASSPCETDGKSTLPTEPLRCRILLAEASLDNQLLLRRLLERVAATVEIVDNGRLALERALSARDNGEPFDVILMDMQLPVLDGYNATRALRKAGYDLPILALTAHAMEADRARCLEAGCDEFVTKPIDRAALLELVRRCVREHKPPDAPES